MLLSVEFSRFFLDMNNDISSVLGDWEYAPGELRVRKIEGRDGRAKIQVRMDLGVMQLEWDGRPDGVRPKECASLLEYYLDKLARSQEQDGIDSFTLSRDDCWDLAQEAMKFYWRRISFFELKEYALAEQDARHNLSILDLCYQYAEAEEDRQPRLLRG